MKKSEAGTTIRLTNANGADDELPVQPGALAALSDGSSLTFGFRAENIALVDAAAAGAAGIGHFTGRVLMTEPLGPETIVLIDVAGTSIAARVAPDLAPHMGTDVRLSVDMRKASYFHVETGVRLT